MNVFDLNLLNFDLSTTDRDDLFVFGNELHRKCLNQEFELLNNLIENLNFEKASTKVMIIFARYLFSSGTKLSNYELMLNNIINEFNRRSDIYQRDLTKKVLEDYKNYNPYNYGVNLNNFIDKGYL